jgi:hypothetical protein
LYSLTFIQLNTELAVRLVAWMLAASTSIVSTELGFLLARGQLSGGSLLDWRILRLRRTIVGHPTLLRPLDIVFSKPIATAVWLIVGPAAAVLSAVALGTYVGLVAALVLVGFALSVALRFPIGRDGADQLALFLSLGMLAYQLAPSTNAARLVLYAICAQLTVSYLVSGVSKLTSVAWRRGDALHAVLRTSCYGNPMVAARINGRLAWGLGLGTAVFEAGFPLVWFVQEPVAVALIAMGLAFHLGVWLIMGLNSFLVTFAAGYPALLWLVLCGRGFLPKL